MKTALVGLGLMVGFFSAPKEFALSQETSDSQLTICSIARDAAKYQDAVVTVHARVASDGMHGTQIYDESCGSFGIALNASGEVAGIDELLAALGKGYRGTRDKIIYGTFTGVLDFKTGDYPRRTLKVRKIEGVTVRMK